MRTLAIDKFKVLVIKEKGRRTCRRLAEVLSGFDQLNLLRHSTARNIPITCSLLALPDGSGLVENM